MKFLHLSDLHIGLKLINRDLQEDQEYILREIAEIAGAEQPDAVLIAGDIYDKAVPSAEAVTVFDSFVRQLRQQAPEAEIMMISGNHDSASRVNVFRSVLQGQRIHMIGLPPMTPEEHIEQVTLHDDFGAVHFYLLPFVKPSMVKQIVGTDEKGNNLSYDESLRRLLAREEVDQASRNVLVSHQFYLPAGKTAEEIDAERTDSEIRTVGNIDQVKADVLEPFDYAALGHIHKPMKVGRDAWRYCGTPIACSVSEAGQQKGVIRVELGAKGDVRTSVIPLHPLREVRIVRGSLGEVLQQGCGDYVRVELTDRVDLDVIDMQEQLRKAFPYLLEVRRTAARADLREVHTARAEEMDPLELCGAFLSEPDAQDLEVLADVINSVRGRDNET